ncbi:carbonic anhydrase family protein [Janthinobacterium sp. 17J80-10]|uniref:carbonic anhydrase n=1 Tax=Janthinobacterium sp. 17J80-10 TaxID=2497863 RepID=UPI0010054A9F|nr:carbonic anhydrase family protein [Janthinobacterium sp. 17J80-10]QAU33759.1 carbonic anhydrase family protein [Janthinobacterium sp. 17J80-10]
MRILFLAFAGMLLWSSAHAIDPRIITAVNPKEEEDMQLLAERISARLATLRKSREARPAAPMPRKKPAAASAAAAGANAPQQGHAWHYDGEGGPAHWGRMNPAWATCASGARQSPIDIRDGIRVDLDPVQFDYRPTRFQVLDNGHTVQVNLSTGNTITVTGRSYELTQFHFHLPSEERINGKGFPMVLHLVHKDAAGRHAVVALLVEDGEPHEVVQQVWNNLPLEKREPVLAAAPLDLDKLMPSRREYYTYMGSMTTPPCSEGVLWIVMKEPIRLSSQQIAIFARLYPMNARPIQEAAGRMIKESN